MALGSAGSLRVASSSHWPKSRSGSSAAVKSPTVNPLGCSIGAASDMSWSTRMAGPVARRAFRTSLYSGTAVASLRLAAVLALALGVERLRGVRSARLDVRQAEQGRRRQPGLCQRGRDRLGRDASRPRRRRPRPRACRRKPTWCSPAWPSSTCSSAAARRSARLGKIRRAARAAPSRRSPAPTAKDGATCRDFLASYVRRQGPETWLQGEACRAKQGAWEVKSLRPWSRS